MIVLVFLWIFGTSIKMLIKWIIKVNNKRKNMPRSSCLCSIFTAWFTWTHPDSLPSLPFLAESLELSLDKVPFCVCRQLLRDPWNITCLVWKCGKKKRSAEDLQFIFIFWCSAQSKHETMFFGRVVERGILFCEVGNLLVSVFLENKACFLISIVSLLCQQVVFVWARLTQVLQLIMCPVTVQLYTVIICQLTCKVAERVNPQHLTSAWFLVATITNSCINKAQINASWYLTDSWASAKLLLSAILHLDSLSRSFFGLSSRFFLIWI